MSGFRGGYLSASQVVDAVEIGQRRKRKELELSPVLHEDNQVIADNVVQVFHLSYHVVLLLSRREHNDVVTIDLDSEPLINDLHALLVPLVHVHYGDVVDAIAILKCLDVHLEFHLVLLQEPLGYDRVTNFLTVVLVIFLCLAIHGDSVGPRDPCTRILRHDNSDKIVLESIVHERLLYDVHVDLRLVVVANTHWLVLFGGTPAVEIRQPKVVEARRLHGGKHRGLPDRLLHASVQLCAGAEGSHLQHVTVGYVTVAVHVSVVRLAPPIFQHCPEVGNVQFRRQVSRLRKW